MKLQHGEQYPIQIKLIIFDDQLYITNNELTKIATFQYNSRNMLLQLARPFELETKIKKRKNRTFSKWVRIR